MRNITLLESGEDILRVLSKRDDIEIFVNNAGGKGEIALGAYAPNGEWIPCKSHEIRGADFSDLIVAALQRCGITVSGVIDESLTLHSGKPAEEGA